MFAPFYFMPFWELNSCLYTCKANTSLTEPRAEPEFSPFFFLFLFDSCWDLHMSMLSMHIIIISSCYSQFKMCPVPTSFILPISLESQEGMTYSLQRRKKKKQTCRRQQKPEILVLNTRRCSMERPVLWPSGCQFYLEANLAWVCPVH